MLKLCLFIKCFLVLKGENFYLRISCKNKK